MKVSLIRSRGYVNTSPVFPWTGPEVNAVHTSPHGPALTLLSVLCHWGRGARVRVRVYDVTILGRLDVTTLGVMDVSTPVWGIVWGRGDILSLVCNGGLVSPDLSEAQPPGQENTESRQHSAGLSSGGINNGET